MHQENTNDHADFRRNTSHCVLGNGFIVGELVGRMWTEKQLSVMGLRPAYHVWTSQNRKKEDYSNWLRTQMGEMIDATNRKKNVYKICAAFTLIMTGDQTCLIYFLRTPK